MSQNQNVSNVVLTRVIFNRLKMIIIIDKGLM